MRPFFLAALLAALVFGLGGNGAAQTLRLDQPSFALPAKFVCGTVDGKWSCRRASGGLEYGKSATPGAVQPRSEPPSLGVTEVVPEAMPPSGEPMASPPPPDGTACQGGMVGTPPNCSCPPSSELLGGNCVHYTATTCSNGLPADGLPQACARIEEKLSCRIREDGMKDCCCVVYDKL